MERRGAFDYIILETSGLADPGNIAPMFWVDDGLASSIYLDSIVTLVDAKNILLSLNEAHRDEVHDESHPTTAHFQISHADVIVINKSDTIDSEHLEYVKDTIQTINGIAKLHVTQYAQVPRLEVFLLDLHAYDGLGSLDTVRKGAHSHLDPVSFFQFFLRVEYMLTHRKTISTLAIPIPVLSASQITSLESWLQSLLWEETLQSISSQPSNYDLSIHRTKGRILTSSGSVKMIQGVREVFEIVDLESTAEAPDSQGESIEQQDGKLVLIGRGLSELPVEESLRIALGL